jgi:hypothetical protein
MDLKEAGYVLGLNLSGLGLGQVAGCCDCGNEPSVFIKREEYFK